MDRGSNNLICPVCDNRFQYKSLLKTHMLTHSEKKNFNCPKCDSSFKRRADLNRHMNLHDDERNVICTVCGKKFSSKKYLDSHMVVHYGEKVYTCTHCKELFKRRHCLKKHMRLHSNEKHISTICNKQSSSNQVLDYQMSLYCDLEWHNCDKCLFSFTSLKTFVLHQRAKHLVTYTKEMNVHGKTSGKENTIPSPEEEILLQNVNDDSKETKRNDLASTSRQTSCIVPSTSNRKTSLKEKMNMNGTVAATIENNVPPKIISKASERANKTPVTYLGDLDSHMTVHTGRKLYTCPLCEKLIKTKYNLCRHLKLHEHFICYICEKQFSFRSTLKSHLKIRHMEIHSKKRPNT